VAFPLGLAALFFALGLAGEEWRALRSGAVWLFGGARRGLASAMERRSEVPPAAARAARRERQRIEPVLGEDRGASGRGGLDQDDEDDDAADVRRPPVPPLQRLARALEEEDDDVELVAAPRQPSRPGRRARSAAQGRLDLGRTGAYEPPALNLLD